MTKKQILLKLQNDALYISGEYVKEFLPYYTSYNHCENLDINKAGYFWNQNLYNKIVSQYIKSSANEISVPVININVFHHELLYALTEVMVSQEYNPCVILSNVVNSFRYMYYIFADEVKHINMCSYINKRIDYDIFITQSNEIIGDINVIIKNNKLYVIIDGKSAEFAMNEITECSKYILLMLM